MNPLLTDLYQLTMVYGHWKCGRHNDRAVFDLFFRRCPFDGEFAVFAGLEEVARFLSTYRFDDAQIDFIARHIPNCDPAFLEWLRGANLSGITVRALREGSLAFPRVPLLQVEGPIAIAQLLETTLLNLVNFPTLVATNAARFKLAAGPGKALSEFGLRRAQGPDGGVAASRYSYLGGFDSTSNVLAGYLYDIPINGTHAHSWVQSFTSLDDVRGQTVCDVNGREHDLTARVLAVREELGFTGTNDDELAAFIAYARAFPRGFLALVDTYDTLQSGVPNFLCVAAVLQRMGYRPIGVRLDSGDLAYLSCEARRLFRAVGERIGMDVTGFKIVASNDINEKTLLSLRTQPNEIDVFGIGTHLVTCQAQPALGGVYKLVEINGQPRIKLSQEVGKVTIPGKKEAYRLLGSEGWPIIDLMTLYDEARPCAGERVLCRHPFDEAKRAYVIPSEVQPLYETVWDGHLNERVLRPLAETRAYVLEQLAHMRPDHRRAINPTPYKVSVSEKLYRFIHDTWLAEAPIAELR